MYSEMTQNVVCEAVYTVICVRLGGRDARPSSWPGIGSLFCSWLQLLSVERYIIKSSLPSGDAFSQPTMTSRGDICISQPVSCHFHTSWSGKQPVKTDWNQINSLRANYTNLGHTRGWKSLATRLLQETWDDWDVQPRTEAHKVDKKRLERFLWCWWFPTGLPQ